MQDPGALSGGFFGLHNYNPKNRDRGDPASKKYSVSQPQLTIAKKGSVFFVDDSTKIKKNT